MAKKLTFIITLKLFSEILSTCHVYRHYWLLPFDTAFIDLDLGDHKVSAKQNLLAIFFSHTFKLLLLPLPLLLLLLLLLLRFRLLLLLPSPLLLMSSYFYYNRFC